MAAAAAVAVRAAPGRMRAWRVHAYGGLDELRLDSVRAPALRAPDQLLVRVRTASINPIDVAMTGGYGARALGALRASDPDADEPPPLVCGRDFVGIVERAGPAARLAPGTRVWGVVPPHLAGAHAEFVVVRERWAGIAPATLDDAQCGGAPYAALTAAAAVRAAGAGAARGARVLLLGLGGVGQAALQLLAARGASVVVGCAPELRELAVRLGAAAALDRRAADYAARIAERGPCVSGRAGGVGRGGAGVTRRLRRFAAVVDCAGLGGEGAVRAARGARYVTLTSPLLRETDARGLWCGALAAGGALAAQTAAARAPVRWALFAPSAEALAAVRALAERGRFAVCVERAFPWWEAREAYGRAAAGGARGKLVLDWTREP